MTLLTLVPGRAWAVPAGAVDPGFGTGGTVTEGSSNSFAGAIYRQLDGEIVLPLELDGQAALERMAANGVPDKSFGDNGIVTVPVNRPDPQDGFTSQVAFGYSGFTAVTEASDGTYYAVGYGDSSGQGTPENPTDGSSIGVIVHLLANGALDPSFGEAGVAYTTMSSGGSPSYPVACGGVPYEVAALPGDQGVVVNTEICGSGDPNYAPPIRMFNRLGLENTGWENTLATDNLPVTAYYPPAYPAVHMALAPDGDLILNRCFIFTPVSSTSILLQRSDDETMAVHLSDGTVDRAYGDGGCSKPLLPATPSSSGEAPVLGSLAEGPSGALAVLATTTDAPSYALPVQGWMTRLTVTGQPDPTFGDGTGALLPLPLNGTSAPGPMSVAISDTGAAVVLGTDCITFCSGWPNEGGAVAALNPDGSVDGAFGTNGVVSLPASAVVSGIELQPSWRTVVSYTSGPPDCEFGGTYFADPVDVQAGASRNAPEACQANLTGLVYPGP